MAPPPPPPPQPTPHHHHNNNPQSSPQTHQFLSNLLSQRGPLSLPYSEDVKWLIRQHLISLTDLYPSLQPKTSTFTHNDGRTVNLLQVDGTIPMLYQGLSYNIPIIIWLLELYPRQPPLVFVNPTKDMIIKRPHLNVTPSGLVNVPYLQKWVYPSSNLLDLVRELSLFFGRDPPLYSQRRPETSTNPNSTNPSSNNPNSSFGSVGNSSNLNSGGGYNPNSSFGSVGNSSNSNYNPNSSFGSVGNSSNLNSGGGYLSGRVFPPSPYVGSGRIMSHSNNRTDDPNEVYKKNAINKLVEMVHGDVVGLRKTREAEMESLFSAQAVLRQREGEINGGLKELIDEKEGLEQQLQLVLTNADVLEGWLRENEEKMEKVKSNVVDVEDAFEPCDSLSKQMLESSASDLAIEDVIYSLDKAVQDGVVPFDQYLKNVRLLSREQFFHRATAAKVRAAQMQAHVASMASRASQYAL